MNVKNKNEVYRCSICGNITEVIHVGMGELVCCGKPMDLLIENSQEASTEKHIPIITKTETGIRVSVGEIFHPMEESHYIQWLEVISNNKSYKKFLTPKDSPQADFCLDYAGDLVVRAYCNLHGLWKNA
ncbi:MAG: desulfoferrodoxin [Parcubacteria group bacterium]|jgi:superoxide reductase